MIKYYRNGFRSTLAILAALPLCTPLSAATVTLFGDDLSFTFDDSSLFGTGVVTGNSLFFQPTNFSAESLNGAGVVTSNETLNIIINTINDDYQITSLAMVEQGDYISNGPGASVAAAGSLGVASNTKNCGLFPCNDFSVFNVGGLGDTGGTLVDWSGGTRVDLADTAGWDSDSSLGVTFQNDLTATTLNVGEQAFIQKKFGAIGIVVNPVPVPAAVWLFGSGLAGLMITARRRRS